MSKYRLPNGLVVNLDDTTGETTVVGGGGRTIAPGARISPGVDISGPAATGSERSTFSRPSAQEKTQSDDQLGISAPMARPVGRVLRPTIQTNPLPQASEISAPAVNAQGEEEPPLVKEDPIGTVGVGIKAAKLGGALAEAVPGLVGKMVGGAVTTGAPTLATTGDPRESARAALVGAAVPVVGVARRMAATGRVGSALSEVAPETAQSIGNAAAERNLERLPTAVTGGATSKAGKAVIGARDILRDTARAHPDLQGPLLTGDGPTKVAAISGKLESLDAANDADYERIAAHHPESIGGRLPAGKLYQKLADFAQKAHEAGDESLLNATKSAIDSVQKFEGDTGTISPAQLRGIRNGLAKKIAGTAPLSTVSREAGAVKGVFNEALGDLADETPGLDATALKTRNRQIASLLPAQNFLEEKAESEAGRPPGTLANIAHAVAHPKDTAVKIATAIPSVIDQHLAKLAGGNPAQHAALKAVALGPTAQTIRQAVSAGVTPQLALQVARMAAGVQQPAVAQ